MEKGPGTPGATEAEGVGMLIPTETMFEGNLKKSLFGKVWLLDIYFDSETTRFQPKNIQSVDTDWHMARGAQSGTRPNIASVPIPNT